MDILSIGTTSEPFSIAKHRRSGIAKWNAGLIDLMFHAQMEAALAQARLLVRAACTASISWLPAASFRSTTPGRRRSSNSSRLAEAKPSRKNIARS